MRDIIQMCFLIVVADITFLMFVIHNSTFGKYRRRLFITAGSVAFADV